MNTELKIEKNLPFNPVANQIVVQIHVTGRDIIGYLRLNTGSKEEILAMLQEFYENFGVSTLFGGESDVEMVEKVMSENGGIYSDYSRTIMNYKGREGFIIVEQEDGGLSTHSLKLKYQNHLECFNSFEINPSDIIRASLLGSTQAKITKKDWQGNKFQTVATLIAKV